MWHRCSKTTQSKPIHEEGKVQINLLGKGRSHPIENLVFKCINIKGEVELAIVRLQQLSQNPYVPYVISLVNLPPFAV